MDRVLLSGVFINSRFTNKALKVLKGEGDSNKVIKITKSTETILYIGQV